ncbi:hypothetical protein BD324DRAFT_652094 [Kockovaella imperatae]|uniref:Uncharacterized protein n=1 Tax=Kockovaella imperatae TaxID=4999 RepID=A0A1Y1UBX8_9TREE|nr:hypothetical protein BD324DRAFT_652094 [Kockovaella imperatae]ORX35543.1 hypothetical protein BD324DRAFT_652094 [Kockovaella imperatae]
MATNPSHSANASHAVDPQHESKVPYGVQNAAPKGLEEALPDSVHNTDPTKDNKNISHATGPSKVPGAIQKAAPEGLERALPESIHPTNKFKAI